MEGSEDREKVDLASELREAVDRFMNSISEWIEPLSSDEKAREEFLWEVRYLLLETELVPYIFAIACGFYESLPSQKTLEGIPKLIERLWSNPLPQESEFLERLSQKVDPERWERFSGILERNPRWLFDIMLYEIFPQEDSPGEGRENE